MTRTLKRLASLVAAGTVLALAATGAAQAYDTDGNGYDDFLLREKTSFGGANVGARCELRSSTSGTIARLTIRPPRVWSLYGFANQRVAWHPVWVNVHTGAVHTTQDWIYSTASPGVYTDFGGSSAGMTTWTQYWNGGFYWEYYPSLGYMRAHVEVAWQNPYTGTWTVRSLPVQWYLNPSGYASSADRITGC